LTINGKNVGATVADGVSYIGSASSGIAKAAAINAVTGDTGVTASVAATTVAGTAITAGAHTAIAAGNILINGVDIGAIGASTTEAERGAQVSAAINAKSGQTGVTATFDTTSGAVALTAADGRNITIGNDGKATSTAAIGAAAETGLASSTTDGGAAGSDAEALAKAGTTTRSVVTLSSSGASGITLGSGGATAASYVATTITGFGAIAAGDIMINGVALGAIAAGTDPTTQGANVAAAINALTAVTGVGVTNTAGLLSFTTATSGGIGVTIKGSANEGLTGFKSGTTNVGDAGATATSLTAGYKAATATAGAGLSSLDFSTSAGAQSALTTIDSAINTINTSRAALGAYQNRFTSTIASLQTTSENLTASRSRIQDADFAKESANLSRAQVLQQAGTAMLAQANQSAQGVLTLLR
jgi:flagellin